LKNRFLKLKLTNGIILIL